MLSPAVEGWPELEREVAGLAPDLRRALAASWARDAQFEHASIASFARFSLELLAVGAPAELVAGAHRAALDEVRHAQLSFALASAYGGRALGPGCLPWQTPMLEPRGLPEIVRSTIIEGCIGETLAASAASVAAAAARPRAVRATLELITRDESEHASLAFRFTSWALTSGARELRDVVAQTFERGITQHRLEDPDALASDRPGHSEHGQLSAVQRHESDLRTLDDVIAPAARELLARSDARRPLPSR